MEYETHKQILALVLQNKISHAFISVNLEASLGVVDDPLSVSSEPLVVVLVFVLYSTLSLHGVCNSCRATELFPVLTELGTSCRPTC